MDSQAKNIQLCLLSLKSCSLCDSTRLDAHTQMQALSLIMKFEFIFCFRISRPPPPHPLFKVETYACLENHKHIRLLPCSALGNRLDSINFNDFILIDFIIIIIKLFFPPLTIVIDNVISLSFGVCGCVCLLPLLPVWLDGGSRDFWGAKARPSLLHQLCDPSLWFQLCVCVGVQVIPGPDSRKEYSIRNIWFWYSVPAIKTPA